MNANKSVKIFLDGSQSANIQQTIRDLNQHKKQLLIRQSLHNANIPNFKTNLVDNMCALRL